MKFNGILVAIFALLLMAVQGRASIHASKQLKIDFTNSTDTIQKATWSEPDKLTVTKNGLGWDSEKTSARDGWIKTRPVAIGLSWRPPYWVSIRVAIHPLPAKLTLNSGQQSTPYAGDMYVRYSPDLKHWSSWQVLQHAKSQSIEEKQNPGRLFCGKIKVPYVERDEYIKLLQEYSKRDVPWKSDEESAVRWILSNKPEFFFRHLPFIGYIEFMFEEQFYGSQRLKSFKADISYGMSGMHLDPKDKKVYNQRDIPWRFRADITTKPRVNHSKVSIRKSRTSH